MDCRNGSNLLFQLSNMSGVRGYETSSGCPCWDDSDDCCIPKHSGYGLNPNLRAILCFPCVVFSSCRNNGHSCSCIRTSPLRLGLSLDQKPPSRDPRASIKRHHYCIVKVSTST